MSEMSIKSIAIQLIRVVRRLQKVKMVHRDIKPENVLLMPDGGLPLGLVLLACYVNDYVL